MVLFELKIIDGHKYEYLKQNQQLDKFPNEGHCKSLDKDLINYLIETRGTTDSKGSKDRSEGVGWNYTSYWYLRDCNNSNKPKYELEQLNKFFSKKQEQWIPQVGDWIKIINHGWGSGSVGEVFKICSIDGKDHYIRNEKTSYPKVWKEGFRKALPHEIPTQELSKEDLLAEAERRYPVGTQFKSALIGDTNPYIGFVKKGMYFSKSENVIWNGDSVGFIYDNGEWAKIVEKPKVTEKSLTKSLVHSMQDDFKDLQVKSMYFEKPLDWSQVLRATGEFSFGTPSQKPVKNNKILPIKVTGYDEPINKKLTSSKILPIKVRNSNITESTELPKRTRIKIIKKQLLTI